MRNVVRDITNSGLTRQRETVLRVVREADEHLTANEIFERSKRLLPGISFATVYNSLRFLKDGGFIAELGFMSGASRFDRKLTRHDHAVCKECGKLADMELELPAELLKKAAEISGFKPESFELTLRGLCPDRIL